MEAAPISLPEKDLLQAGHYHAILPGFKWNRFDSWLIRIPRGLRVSEFSKYPVIHNGEGRFRLPTFQ